MTLTTPHRGSRTRCRQGAVKAEAARRLQELALGNDSGDEATSKAIEIAAELTGALGVVFLPRDVTGKLRLTPEYFSSTHLEHLRGLLQQMLRLATVASAEESAQAGAAEGDDGIIVVAVPVLGGQHGTEALAAAIGVESETQSHNSAAFLRQILTWVAAFLTSLRTPTPNERAQDTGDLMAFHEMLADAATQVSFEGSCQLVAEWIRTQKQATLVAIGVQRGWRRQCQLIASTGGSDFDSRSDTVGCLREVMEESIIADAVVESELDASLLHTTTPEQLTRISGLTVTQRIPLRDVHGSTFGVVLYLSDQAHEHRQVQPLSSKEQSILGRQLGYLRATAPNPLFTKLGLGRGNKWNRHPFVWSTLGMVALFMMLPMPLIVKCPCRVQPQKRRFISVPYEGRLQQALTEPGEVVRAGQLLARMDDRDVTWEISKLNADLRRAEKDRDVALASFDTSTSQLAGLEAERLRLQIEELQDRLDNLEIRSPIDGVVIGGDPRKLEGARLSMGETLLEIGPLDKMVVELEIPDEDISHLQRKQVVKFRLNALPGQSFAGTVNVIRPQSELRNDNNVFVAETGIENADGRIRPGMRGKARVTTARHPLVWNVFHKPWSNLRMWIAW